MTKGDIFRQESLSATDHDRFDRWFKANVLAGAIVGLGLGIISLASSNSLGPQAALADSGAPIEEAATGGTPALSAYELMIRIAPDQLPVQQVAEPY